jgi:hypothetical protein
VSGSNTLVGGDSFKARPWASPQIVSLETETFTFGGGLSYAFDRLNRAIPGRYDFIGVSMHELAEIMGRAPEWRPADFNSDGHTGYLHVDLFNYYRAATED